MLLTSINSTQREIKELWAGQDGVTTQLSELWAGIDGTNKQIFSSFSPDPILNNNDWATISKASTLKIAESIWSVGDRKEVAINGKLSNGLTLNEFICYPYILGFNHNSEIEGDGTVTFQIGFSALNGGANIAFVDRGYDTEKTSGNWFNMQNKRSNSGGWESSRMRTTIIPAFKICLPSDLQNALKTVTKYTENTGGGSNSASTVTPTTEDIFLLSEFEVFGVIKNANVNEQNYQRRYDYYSNGNSSKKFKHKNTAVSTIWKLRSATANTVKYYCCIGAAGGTNKDFASITHGFSPAFVV